MILLTATITESLIFAGAQDIIDLAKKINNSKGVYNVAMEGHNSNEEDNDNTLELTEEQQAAADKARAEQMLAQMYYLPRVTTLDIQGYFFQLQIKFTLFCVLFKC